MYILSNHALQVLLQFSYGDKQPINSLEFHYINECSNQLLMNRIYQTDTWRNTSLQVEFLSGYKTKYILK